MTDPDLQDAQTDATPATPSQSESDGTPALVVKRADEPPVDTAEIIALTEAAGYAVVDQLTQIRPEAPDSYLGAGKVDALAERARETAAQLVVVDDELTPTQTQQLADATPPAATVVDRYRLILDIFAEQAETKRAQLQVELAQLRYDRPRIERESDPQQLNIMLEKGTRLDDVRNRIAELEARLEAVPNTAEHHRAERREQGFGLVAVAGYTNAGKSTLLHRLADELTLTDGEPDHPDQDTTAAIEDRLFKTLATTTRRATIGGRPVLLTDTVGFVQDLPHGLVASFSDSLSEIAGADTVMLVADASNPPAELREKVEVSLDVLTAQGVALDDIVTVLNKIDLLDDQEREQRLAVARNVAPTPVPVSATDGEHVDALTDAIVDQLPTERAVLSMPNCDDAMSVVSWAYDRLRVETIDYTGETVQLSVAGQPATVNQARAKVQTVAQSSDSSQD